MFSCSMLGVCDFLVRGWFRPRTKRCGRKRRKKTKLHISRLNWEDFLAFCVCQGWWLAILAGDSRTERIGRAAGNSLAKESMMRLVGAPVEVEDKTWNCLNGAVAHASVLRTWA
jgi:hypothetical protein